MQSIKDFTRHKKNINKFFNILKICWLAGGIGGRMPPLFSQLSSAEILEQSVGARNRVGKGFVVTASPGYKTGGIDALESIQGLLKSLKIPSLDSV
jgi:hypothetical protein